MAWVDDLKKAIRGEVLTDAHTLKKYSTDASLFEVTPQVVVRPRDAADLKKIVVFVNEHTKEEPTLSLTARSAGTDMSGGPLNESIIVSFTEHMNHFTVDAANREATVQAGVYYRDFEKETLRHGLLLPSYPASKSIAALGGLINNNSAGEKTLYYGKTNKYVKQLKMVLRDGNEYTFKKIDTEELESKRAQNDFEGEVYRRTHDLLERNYDVVQKARPNVSKNSAGYALWDVWDREHFDLTQLFCGAQGTLGLMSEAHLKLVKPKKHRKMAVLFLKDWDEIPSLVNAVLPLDPEGIETFDDATLKLALRFFPEIAARVEGQNLFTLAWQFIPEFFIGIRMLGLPKLIMLVQFAEDSDAVAEEKLADLEKAVAPFRVHKRILHTEAEAEKYWVIRRESFALLRKHVSGKRTAPFIDDFIVQPDKLPEFLPKIFAILKEYDIKATLAGHAGSGNFHIIPLMDLSKQSEIDKIPAVSDKVYALIVEYKGSITAEHNDGLIRSPYLEQMYGPEVYHLFEEIKNIFDPDNIFNPGKKVNSSLDYAIKHIQHT